MTDLHNKLNQVVDFHGHRCPGIAYGLRIALTAIEEIDIKQGDETIVQAESNLCPIDAIQVITGCTLGNGKLIFMPTGKQVFSFWNITAGKAVRIVCNKILQKPTGVDQIKSAKSLLESKIDAILASESTEFLEISTIHTDPPVSQRF